MGFDAKAAAQAIANAHATRTPYENLSGDLAPPTIDDAYRGQDALAAIWEPERGHVAGAKIATTTKVMQELMGIDHPTAGLIFANRIHSHGATVPLSDFMHLVVECELLVELDRDLDAQDTPHTRDSVRSAIRSIAAAFELIEDRNAVYRSCDAKTLIVDNSWNGGIVVGEMHAWQNVGDLDGLSGRLVINDDVERTGQTDDPLGALAWVANNCAARGRPLKAGQVVITGSLITPTEVKPGDRLSFEIDGVGRVAADFA